MKKCLVTGASGFVGSALCQELVYRGYQVVAAYRSASDAVHSQDITIVGDIDSHTQWDDALKGVEVIFHTAARVHVMEKVEAKQHAEFSRVNRLGTERLARAASRVGVKRLVYLSSIKVNGEQTIPPHRFIEKDISSPQDAYAVSKYEAEQALYQIASETKLEVVIIRPPLIYGPNVKGNFKTLLKVLIKRIPLPLASVSNRRDFIALDNLLDAMVLCGTHPNAKNQTYLVSDGKSLSTPMLIEHITNALGRRCIIYRFPVTLLSVVGLVLRKSKIVNRLIGSLEVDASKIRRDLDWTPPITVKEGFRRMVAKDQDPLL